MCRVGAGHSLVKGQPLRLVSFRRYVAKREFGDEVTECYKDVRSFSVARQVLSIKLKTLQCCCVVHGHYAIRCAFLEQRQTGIWLKSLAFYTFTLLIHHDITAKTIFSIKCQLALCTFTLLIRHDITNNTIFSIKCQQGN